MLAVWLQGFLDHFTYLGIFAVLLGASLGLPIPEEVPIIAAAVLSQQRLARWWIALPVCILGVLSGDVILYWSGRHWGEQLLRWRVVQMVLDADRAERLKAAYRRHAIKTIVVARHVMGLRPAAFLTAGIAHVPFWKFLLADGVAATLGVPVGFGLAYFFTDRLQDVVAHMHRVQRWVTIAFVLALVLTLGVASWKRQRKR